MPSATNLSNPHPAPSLSTFLIQLKQTPASQIETPITSLIHLLKSRAIRSSLPCALATTHLLLRVVAAEKLRPQSGSTEAGNVGATVAAQRLIERVREVGRRLIAAQPRELAVGNLVRRVLGAVREVVKQAQEEEDGEDDAQGLRSPVSSGSGAASPPAADADRDASSPLGGMTGSLERLDLAAGGRDGLRRPQVLASSASYAGQGPQISSLMSLLEDPAPASRSPFGTPPTGTPHQSSTSLNTNTNTTNTSVPTSATTSAGKSLDIKAEVISSLQDLLEELTLSSTQIAEHALDHIHSNETLLTHGGSSTIQSFLLAAALKKRKFTVIHAENWPNGHEDTHAMILQGGKRNANVGVEQDGDEKWRPLTSLGITVVLIPDTAVFALMSRVTKCLISPSAVLADGSLLAPSGTSTLVMAAQHHRVPVVVLAPVYKLSPVYPFDVQGLIEYGDPGKVVSWGNEGEFVEKVDVSNPVQEVVEAGGVDLFVTGLGPCAPGFLYRVVGDHYWGVDNDLGDR